MNNDFNKITTAHKNKDWDYFVLAETQKAYLLELEFLLDGFGDTVIKFWIPKWAVCKWQSKYFEIAFPKKFNEFNVEFPDIDEKKIIDFETLKKGLELYK